MKPLEKARQDLEKAKKKRDASKKRLEWSSKMPRSVKAGLQWKRQIQKLPVSIKKFRQISRKREI